MQQKTSNSKEHEDHIIYSWDATNAPSSRNHAPRFQEEKKKGRYKLLLYQNLKEMLRVGRSTSTRKRAGCSWKERSSWRSKRTRDQLHGPELAGTLERLSRRYKRFEDIGGKLSERTNKFSCEVMIFSTPLTRIVTPPNDDVARFRRIAEKIGLRRTKMEGATITLIHQFNVTKAMIRVVGMVATPSRTQSITRYTNRRIMQSTSRIQIGDLSKKR